MNKETTNHILRALNATAETLGYSHLKRKDGSFLPHLAGKDREGEATYQLLAELSEDFEEVTEHAKEIGAAFGSCRYFKASLPPMLWGLECIAEVKDLSDEELESVRLVRGHHGEPELQSDTITPRRTSTVHLVTGEHEGQEVVFTWYPGKLTPPGLSTVKLKRG